MEPLLIRSVTFDPFIPGMGPTFTLCLWDLERRDEYGKHILKYRLTMQKEKFTVSEILFEGEDYHLASGQHVDSDEAVEGIMSFLTLKPGDTDEDYFKDYTQEQLEYCSKYAEALSAEVSARFGDW